MKEQLFDQILDDYVTGDICSDGKATLEFIKDLVMLLEDDAVKQFARMYEYDLEQEPTP